MKTNRAIMSMKSLCVAMAALLCATAATAQDETKVKAFSHLSLGVEVSTAGIGVELAAPLHKHFALRAGFTALPLKYGTAFDIDYGETADGMNALDKLITDNNLGPALSANGLPTSTRDMDTEAELDAKLGLMHGKLLVDVYPSKKGSFHFTAGMFFSNGKLATVTGKLPEDVVKVTNVINENLGGDAYAPSIVLGDNSIAADEDGEVDVFVKTWKVKPYVGIGFGRAVPKKRLGCQFDLGVMFHGRPSIDSSNSEVRALINDELESSGITDILQRVTVYPMISLKIVGRIF